MIREFNYPKEAKPKNVKRDLHGIKKVIESQVKFYERTEDKDLVDLSEYGVEVVKVFNSALNLALNYLKKIGIDTSNIGEFTVCVTKDEEIGGRYSLIYDKIYINESKLADEDNLKKTLVHEIFHKISANLIHTTQYKQEDNEFITKFKSGYSSEYVLLEEKTELMRTKKKVRFESFNEGVTEIMTVFALHDDLSEYVKTSSYSTEIAMVSAIIRNVYKNRFKDFIDGYFSGNIMHLREIEKYYGKNSLKLLATIDTKKHYEHTYKDDTNLLEQVLRDRNFAIEFFITQNEARKEELRKKFQIDQP